MTTFEPLLDLLAGVSDPRRGQGQKYKLPHVLLFSILAIVTGCNSYRGIVTFIDVHRRRLNATFGLKWRRAPAHTAIRYILKGLDPADVEMVFRQHAVRLQAARTTSGNDSIALDGKTLRGSFDNFNDRAAAQVLSAFAVDTSLVLAHVDIAEKSNEIPAAQALLAELGVPVGAIVTLDAIHCQKNLMWTALGEQDSLICRLVKAAPMYVAADVSNPGAGDGSVAAEPTWRVDCLQFGEIEVADYL